MTELSTLFITVYHERVHSGHIFEIHVFKILQSKILYFSHENYTWTCTVILIMNTNIIVNRMKISERQSRHV